MSGKNSIFWGKFYTFALSIQNTKEMKHKDLIFTISLIIFTFFFSNATAQNESGGVRIRFGNDGEYAEPQTLSGDNLAIPVKPKRTFSTNSIVLNQILQSCDEGYDSLSNTMEKLRKMEKVTVAEQGFSKDVFTIVYNSDTHEIVAVLDKGTGKKMNLLTNQFETDEKFAIDIYLKIYFLINE